MNYRRKSCVWLEVASITHTSDRNGILCLRCTGLLHTEEQFVSHDKLFTCFTALEGARILLSHELGSTHRLAPSIERLVHGDHF